MVRRVKAYLKSMKVITDEDELHKMSLECEPPLGGVPHLAHPQPQQLVNADPPFLGGLVDRIQAFLENLFGINFKLNLPESLYSFCNHEKNYDKPPNEFNKYTYLVED